MTTEDGTHVVDMPDESTVMDLMRCLDHFIEGTVAVVDGSPVPDDLPLRDGLSVTLVRVGSSG